MKKTPTVGEILQAKGVSRRGFLKYCATTASILALPPTMIPRIAEAIEDLHCSTSFNDHRCAHICCIRQSEQDRVEHRAAKIHQPLDAECVVAIQEIHIAIRSENLKLGRADPAKYVAVPDGKLAAIVSGKAAGAVDCAAGARSANC